MDGLSCSTIVSLFFGFLSLWCTLLCIHSNQKALRQNKTWCCQRPYLRPPFDENSLHVHSASIARTSPSTTFCWREELVDLVWRTVITQRFSNVKICNSMISLLNAFLAAASDSRISVTSDSWRYVTMHCLNFVLWLMAYLIFSRRTSNLNASKMFYIWTVH